MASANQSAECALTALKPTKVVPYRVSQRLGRGVHERLVGASVFVPAQSGLTAEWIGAKVEGHLRGMKAQGMPDCPFAVSSVKVSVAAGSTGYWVHIAGKNATDAEQILARARTLVR
jgi:hypothetical protein